LICFHWNCLANEDVLFRQLLRTQFPKAFKVSNGQSFKELYIQEFQTNLNGSCSLYAGLGQCERCKKLFWLAENKQTSCKISMKNYQTHTTDGKLNAEKILENLIMKHNITFFSDVLFL